jgi:hypothetical protein
MENNNSRKDTKVGFCNFTKMKESLFTKAARIRKGFLEPVQKMYILGLSAVTPVSGNWSYNGQANGYACLLTEEGEGKNGYSMNKALRVRETEFLFWGNCKEK